MFFNYTYSKNLHLIQLLINSPLKHVIDTFVNYAMATFGSPVPPGRQPHSTNRLCR